MFTHIFLHLIYNHSLERVSHKSALPTRKANPIIKSNNNNY